MKAWTQKRFYFLLMLLYAASVVRAQNVLDDYARKGVEQNMNVLKLKGDYSYALWVLKESKRLLGPSVDVNSSYTRNFREPIDLNGLGGSSGGSDLLDIFKNLNSGTVHDGKLYFPTTENQIGFALTGPQTLYNRPLNYITRVKEENSSASLAMMEDVKAELDGEIRDAYFQYLRALFLIIPIEKAITTAKQNLEATTQLIAQKKLTKEDLYRSKASLAQFHVKLANMENTKTKARNYFNFLLNRPLEDSIVVDSFYSFNATTVYSLNNNSQPFREGYKLDYLLHQETAAAMQQKVFKTQHLPVLQLQATGGASGSRIDFSNSRMPYALVKISATWNLFNNGAAKARKQQAYYQQQSLHAQYEYMQAQLQSNELAGLSDVQTQLQNYVAIKESYNSAQVYYTAILQKYLVGMSTILELTDAQNQLLQSEMDRLDWYYTLQQQIALYQKSTGKKIKINP